MPVATEPEKLPIFLRGVWCGGISKTKRTTKRILMCDVDEDGDADGDEGREGIRVTLEAGRLQVDGIRRD